MDMQENLSFRDNYGQILSRMLIYYIYPQIHRYNGSVTYWCKSVQHNRGDGFQSRSMPQRAGTLESGLSEVDGKWSLKRL
jgi:hypothetical protein